MFSIVDNMSDNNNNNSNFAFRSLLKKDKMNENYIPIEHKKDVLKVRKRKGYKKVGTGKKLGLKGKDKHVVISEAQTAHKPNALKLSCRFYLL